MFEKWKLKLKTKELVMDLQMKSWDTELGKTLENF